MTLPSLDFYCDESSFTASKYAAVNGRHLKADASPHKSHLAENVRSGFGVPNFAINTPWEGRRATVWNWKEQKLGRPRS
jgi:hypothetical protein